MAEDLIERVRECEIAAAQSKQKAKNDAQEMLANARRLGERRLALAEREAEEILLRAEKESSEEADKLLEKAKEEALAEAAMLEKNALSRMDKAVALILQRVGGVWQSAE